MIYEKKFSQTGQIAELRKSSFKVLVTLVRSEAISHVSKDLQCYKNQTICF